MTEQQQNDGTAVARIPEEIRMAVLAVLESLGVVNHPDAPLPAQEFYSIKNCAVVSGMSTDHIRRAILGGVMTASNVGTNDRPIYRVHKDNLRLWLTEREEGAKPPRQKQKPMPVSPHHKPKSKSAKQSA